MGEVANVVSTVGFPIAIALAFGGILYKVFMVMFNKIMESLKASNEANEKLLQTNQQIVETNKLLAKDVMDKLNEIIDIVK